MNKELLELLACPVCHRELDLDSETTNGERVRSGRLICAQEHSFPIHQSVPVFASTERYVEAFSVPRQPRPGVPALPTRSPELDVQALTRDEFWRQTQVEPEDLRGKTVLDAGCGGGRFVELLSGHGARVVGVDVDLAGLDQASAALGAKPNVDLVQANLFRLPFRRGAFDFIYSLGVLHHTPDPKAAFLELVPLLKPGGRIAVWVYPRSPATPVSDILRPITTRIPPRSLLWLAWIVTASYGPLLRIPRLGRRLKSLLYRARLPWHDDLEWRVHSFVDWYGARYQFKYAPEELECWFSDAGLVDVRRCPYATSARGAAV